jgi:hypothetical protein
MNGLEEDFTRPILPQPPHRRALDYHQPMSSNHTVLRRDVLTAAGTALTTSLFTGRVKGANDRISIGFIGVGTMGSSNLGYAMQTPELQPVAICDVYRPHRDRAVDAAQKGGVPGESRGGLSAKSWPTAPSTRCASPRPTTGMPI